MSIGQNIKFAYVSYSVDISYSVKNYVIILPQKENSQTVKMFLFLPISSKCGNGLSKH